VRIVIALGGNALLKWLGERNAETELETAVAVSVPFELDAGGRRMELGFSTLYRWELVTSLKRSIRRKFRTMESPIDLSNLEGLVTFRDFDEHVTAPLHGFDGATDYYNRCSSRQYLDAIDTPTLIIHAEDDPFVFAHAIPRQDELSPTVELELSACGGHVGFVSGATPWRPSYWLDQRIASHLGQHL